MNRASSPGTERPFAQELPVPPLHQPVARDRAGNAIAIGNF